MIFLCAYSNLRPNRFHENYDVHREPPHPKFYLVGSSIRLEQMTMALQGAGHEVHLCQYIPHSIITSVSTPNQLFPFARKKT